MFTTTNTAAPTLSTTTVTPASPTSPTRSRLRGLSYLRNYTQNLHARSESEASNRNSRPSFPRARSQPSDSTRDNNNTEQSTSLATPQPAPTRRAPSPPNTNGWVPAANTTHGTSRAPIRQQSTPSEAPSSGPAPTVTTAESTPARPMTRSRSETAGAVLSARNQLGPTPRSPGAVDANGNGGDSLPSIRFIPHFDPRANRPSLSFPAVTRTLPSEASIIRVGRYSERENLPDIPSNTPSSAPVGFKSKVVSRRHCEFWCQNSQWYVKDVKSSSGTFLNHLRLSPPGQESRAYAVNDGDVVQLGIDFRGGEEMIFRCVKIRIECNRGWQKALNNFNKKTHKQLLARTKLPKKDSDTASVNSSECSICLMSIAPCQSLFVAPCSHVWHYKCIRPILNGHTWPNFLCPNCRAVADLEADVEEQEEAADSEDWDDEEVMEAALEVSRRESIHGTVAEPEGLRTPRAMQPVQDRDTQAGANLHDEGDISPPLDVDDDLTDLAAHLSLTETRSESDDSPDDHHDNDGNHASSSSLAVPLTIPPRGMMIARRDVSPNSHPLGGENVMTPRNDAGPFVLDGGAGAGRTGAPMAGAGNGSGRRALGGAVSSLDAAANDVGLGPV